MLPKDSTYRIYPKQEKAYICFGKEPQQISNERRHPLVGVFLNQSIHDFYFSICEGLLQDLWEVLVELTDEDLDVFPVLKFKLTYLHYDLCEFILQTLSLMS